MNIIFAGLNTGASKAASTAFNTSFMFRFSKEQLTSLHQNFKLNPYPHLIQLNQLATALNVDVDKVQHWFQHKRGRSKYLHVGEFQNS